MVRSRPHWALGFAHTAKEFEGLHQAGLGVLIEHLATADLQMLKPDAPVPRP